MNTDPFTAWGPLALVTIILSVALPFKPWLPLRHGPLQTPWLAAMALLPFLWATEKLLPNGMALHVTGTCLMVLMFGWPLAMWSVIGVAFGGLWMSHAAWPPDWNGLLHHIVWRGMIPGSLALGIGLGVRRYMPDHLFVYILGRGFIGTGLAVSISGVLAWLFEQKPVTLGVDEWILAHWLLGWAEAFSTGMLTAIFVAFKPHWMLTYSDALYLPSKPQGPLAPRDPRGAPDHYEP